MQRTYQLAPQERLSIPDAGMETLKRLGARRRYRDGQVIARYGDKSDGFWVIVEGQVMSGRYASNGSLTIFGVYGPGDVFGELAYFADIPRVGDGVADGDTELLFIDAAQCRRALEHDVDLALLLLRSLARQLQTAANRIDEHREQSAPVRLAKALLNMSEASNGVVKSSQQQLADYIGVSRVTLSASLRRLRAEGLVMTRYGAVELVDPEALADWIEQAGVSEV